MPGLYAIKVRLYPPPAQEVAFRQIAGCCRMVFNLGLEQRRDFWRAHKREVGKHISWMGQKREVTVLKSDPECAWLKSVPAHCLQMALHDLDTAFQRFFNGLGGYPKFRKRGDGDRFTFPDRKQIVVKEGRDGLLVLPKFGKTKSDNGPIRARIHRPLQGQVRSVTISCRGDRWFASILLRQRVAVGHPSRAVAPVVRPENVVGTDRGTAVPVATSEGVLMGVPEDPVRQARKAQRRLLREKRLQQKLARQQKGSKNREKTKRRLARHRAREADRRQDARHKMTHALACGHVIIVIEDLKITNMTASAKGTVEEPGRNVAQKAGLNRAILDTGWGEMERQLIYKTAWRGGRVVKVSAHHSSQTCAACGHVDAASRVSRDRFACTRCPHQAHADINAAMVIRQRGLVALGLAKAPARKPKGSPSVGTVEDACGALCMRHGCEPGKTSLWSDHTPLAV